MKIGFEKLFDFVYSEVSHGGDALHDRDSVFALVVSIANDSEEVVHFGDEIVFFLFGFSNLRVFLNELDSSLEGYVGFDSGHCERRGILVLLFDPFGECL